MGLGIALGGFSRGLEAGYGLGRNIKEDRRTDKNRADLAAVDTQGKQDYEAQGGGMGGAGDFDTFYNKYVVPKKVATLIQQGDLDGAKKFTDWSEADSSRKGAKLFGQGMLAGQAGDMKTAIGKFVEAGKIQGYGGDYDISGAKEMAGGGWQVDVTGADGTKHDLQFKTPDDVLQFGATYLNPEKAFADWQAQQSEGAKSQRELSTERAKLGMRTEEDLTRRDLGLGNKFDAKPAKPPSALEIRKQAFDELKDSAAYQEADEPTQQKMLQARITAIGGAAGGDQPPPAPARVIVDTQSGAQVDPGAAAPQEAPAPTEAAPAKERIAVGLGRGGGSASNKKPSKVQRPVIVNPGGDIVDAGTGEHVGKAADQAVTDAMAQLQKGADPAVVRLALRTAQVPLSQWPDVLKPSPRAASH